MKVEVTYRATFKKVIDIGELYPDSFEGMLKGRLEREDGLIKDCEIIDFNYVKNEEEVE
jgi:hypothetical protein